MENIAIATRLNTYGQKLYHEGDQSLAMEYFYKSMELYPEHADAYHNLSIGNMKRGEIQKALVYMKKALDINPRSSYIAADAKKIQEFCLNIQKIPQNEQINFILKLQEENESELKKMFATLWDKAWYEHTLERWNRLQKLVSEGPVYDSKEQQSLFEKNDENRDFQYIGCPLCQNQTYRVFYHQTKSRYPVAQCSSCKFLYRNPTYRTGYIPKVYNRVNLQFLRGSYSKNRDNIYNAYLKALGFEAQTAGFTRRRLLDIGCGYGLFLKTIQGTGWELYGLDFAQDCVDFANEEFKLKNVFAGNLEEDSFEENFFDAVTLWSVAAHLENPLEMFKKIHRVLCPGGILLIYTVDSASLNHQEKLSHWGGFHGNHLVFFNPDSLNLALRISGFETTRCVSDQVYSKLITGEVAPKDNTFFKELSKTTNLGSMMAVTCRKV